MSSSLSGSSVRGSGLASGDADGGAEPLTFLEDLSNGGITARTQRAQVAQYVMGNERFTDEKCYQMVKTMRFQEEFLRQIEEAANRYSLQHGQEIPKGFVVDKISLDYKQLAVKEYLAWFFKNDPVPFNHNGRTTLVTKDARGVDVDDATQDLLEFGDYLTEPRHTAVQKADGLEYFENRQGETYQKYNMPDILFTVGAANAIVIGPSTNAVRFREDRTIIEGNVGDAVQLSYDSNNLKAIEKAHPPTPLTTKKITDQAILNERYTFPNFLSGDMLLLKFERTTAGDERIRDSTIIGRPFASEYGDGAELWVKYYDKYNYFVPYDETIYVFPPGFSLLVRADDMVMYYHQSGAVSFTPPIGSYYKKPPAAAFNSVFRDSARYDYLNTEVQAQVDTIAAGSRGGILTPAMMMTPAFQKNLKAFSYLQNLVYIRDTEHVAAGGKKTSKPTKRTKIIKYMAKSKKKYHR
jgi:hypothetical protein